MAWLLRDGTVLGSLEIAATRRQRRRGLLGRDGITGALLLERSRSVHTMGMRFAIDVAHLDRDRRVLRVTTMAPWRLGSLVPGARSVLEAEAGLFASWDLGVDQVLEVVDASEAER